LVTVSAPRISRDFCAAISGVPLLFPTENALGPSEVMTNQFWRQAAIVAATMMQDSTVVQGLSRFVEQVQMRYPKGRMPLGVYHETLLDFWLARCGFLEILAAHLRLSTAEGTTAGEIDWIIKFRDSQVREHWESAVKFYLAEPNAQSLWQFHGPNCRDNFGRKYQYMLERQLKHALPQFEPLRRVCLIKGRLFFPWRPGLRAWTKISEGLWALTECPDSLVQILNPDAPAGVWIYASQLKQFSNALLNPSIKDVQNRIQVGMYLLPRIWWLSEIHFDDLPNLVPATEEMLMQSESANYVSLCALCANDESPSTLAEIARFFVVPDGWGAANSSS
jgi:Domain of unknown function (DUF1853)